MKPSIASINRALDAEDFRQVSDFAEEACYSYGERDDDKHKPTGLTCDLDPEEDEDDTIVGIIESLIYARFPEIQDYKLYRAYINCFAPREIANFHVDCDPGEDQVTFIFYANKTYNGLNEGGCTEFFLDEKIIGVPPIPNTLIKFTSSIMHRATPLKSDHRFTYALKYCKENN
tara:strand:+ start:730 stop:1251 length:522 start_codon:yes stop_codon:yes gene_type:complete